MTAACLAEHFPTVGCDPDADAIRRLGQGHAPLAEHGLDELIKTGIASGRLSFTSKLAGALRNADLIWVTFDTPVNDKDKADYGFIRNRISRLFPHLKEGALVAISSQVPVGFTAQVEHSYRKRFPRRRVSFAYLPENLRLGQALDAFRHPARIVAGVRQAKDRERLALMLAPFSRSIEWMSVESAEMTKHALNAFLGMSVAFANEMAALAERVGADAKEIERGLKSDERIGPRAYLAPGSAFAGGTLARDITFLEHLGRQKKAPTPLMSAVMASNEAHKSWPQHKIKELLGRLWGKKIAVLGLTYKPGTDTLRRSSAIELCRWLATHRAQVHAYDPAISKLPRPLERMINLCSKIEEALHRADALYLATAWPVFRELSAGQIASLMRRTIVIDPNRFLEFSLAGRSNITYAAVGRHLSSNHEA